MQVTLENKDTELVLRPENPVDSLKLGRISARVKGCRVDEVGESLEVTIQVYELVRFLAYYDNELK